MKKLKTFLQLALVASMFTYCTNSPKSFKIEFDGSKEVSGQKIAINDITPNLPTNWDEYNYVVLEYKISTAQRFQVGFTTDYGYNEVRIMSYVPNQWNKLAIPLKFYKYLPDPEGDLAGTNNQPRYTGWVNLGGERGPLHGVDSIGFRMRKAIDNPVIEIRSLALSVEDPGDLYMGEIPAVDEFGQSNLVDYPEKIYSLEQLKKEWKAEEDEIISTDSYNYSKYGGYKNKRVKATGYFRTEKIDGVWWFIDPEGYLFLSVGVDCVNIGSGGIVRDLDKRANMYDQLPPAEIVEKYSRGNNGRKLHSFGIWNLYRRFGDSFQEKSKEIVFKRMDKWGLNTIANWSSPDIYNMNRKAFLVPLNGLGGESKLMGLCDIYADGYKDRIEKSISRVVQPNNPWLIGYFIGNEPAWLGEEERLCSLILEGEERPIKKELAKYLKKEGDTPENRKKFIFEAFREFLVTSNKILKEQDPNHLNLGIRFGHLAILDERILEICGESFDVLSFNCYDMMPPHDVMDRAYKHSKLPMIIGEYHFGTSDRGMAQSLWQVDTQKDRGVMYRYYTENAYDHPCMIGTGYFQWGDQDMTGRTYDGENYNCGLVDVTDRPYKDLVDAVMKTSERLYDVHSGRLKPTQEISGNPRGYELIPDLWNE